MYVLVKLYDWEQPKAYETEVNINVGDKVIVASEYAHELGEVIKTEIVKENEESVYDKILRVATKRDKEVFLEYEKKKEEFVDVCRAEVKKINLGMKVVDARISLDGKQIIFVFTADGRIDFRELVKELSRLLKKSIRMQQVGTRDEARRLGGYGICGRDLCCVNFSGSIQSITTDMARMQQIAHRGTERISGLCGRLMCCLSYESEQYKELLKGMPELYSVVNTKEGRGTVVEINAIKQEVKVKLANGQYVNIKKGDL